MTARTPISTAELAGHLDAFEERLQRATRDRGDMGEDHRTQAGELQVRAAALRARLDEGRGHEGVATELEADWYGLFAAFEAWIARLDERQSRFNL